MDNYLSKGWYKLRIEENNQGYLVYTLNKTGKGQVANEIIGIPDASLSTLTNLEWSTTKNPIVCPMFFWDDHILGLSLKS